MIEGIKFGDKVLAWDEDDDRCLSGYFIGYFEGQENNYPYAVCPLIDPNLYGMSEIPVEWFQKIEKV